MSSRFLSASFISLFLALLCAGKPAALSAQNDQAQKYILDYDVPESPALIAAGAATSNVLRGSVAKPVVAHLVNQFRAGQKVDNGIALDFSPYFVFGGRLTAITEYRENAIKRMLANTQFSVATAQSAIDTASLIFGLGFRTTLFDSHDLLADPTLSQDIDTLLSQEAHAPNPENVGDDIIRKKVKRVDLSAAYENARLRARNKKGGALTLGWGMSGLMRGSVADGDSIQSVRHSVWAAYRYSFGRGTDLQAMGQWRENEAERSVVRGGMALRTNGESYSLATELFYDSNQGKLASGRIGIGANGELRILRGVSLIASLATEPVALPEETVSRLRVRTSLRWNMSSEP